MAGESGVIFVDEKIDSAADLLVSLPKARSAGAALVATENPSVAINTEWCRLVVERTFPTIGTGTATVCLLASLPHSKF